MKLNIYELLDFIKDKYETEMYSNLKAKLLKEEVFSDVDLNDWFLGLLGKWNIMKVGIEIEYELVGDEDNNINGCITNKILLIDDEGLETILPDRITDLDDFDDMVKEILDKVKEEGYTKFWNELFEAIDPEIEYIDHFARRIEWVW